MMNRMFALVLRDYKIFMTTHWRLIELLYFPITTILIWGVFAIWTRDISSTLGTIALAVNIFWSWAYTVQSTINMAINEDSWSGSIPELFATGLNKWEYIVSRVALSAILSTLNILIIAAIAQYLGLFDFVSLLVPALVMLGIIFILSASLATLIAGVFFVAGAEHTWLSWSAMQFFILLSSPLAPPAILPQAFQTVAAVMPFTALFEGVRAAVTSQPWLGFAQQALLIAVAYAILGIVVYHLGFERARRTGNLARMV